MRSLLVTLFVAVPCAARRTEGEHAAGNQTSCSVRRTEVEHAAGKQTNCSSLGGLTLRGQAVGDMLTVVCDAWLTVWGEFPISSARDAEHLLSETFAPGGMFVKVRKLVTTRLQSGDFCWKHRSERPAQEPTGHSCPMYFNRLAHKTNEKPTEEQPTATENGELLCIKSCNDACGDWLNLGADADSHTCRCRSRYQLHQISHFNNNPGMTFQPYDDTFEHLDVNRAIQAVPDGCALVHNGDCYGQCPAGSESASMAGLFRTVCETKCAGGVRPVECGFGCARSAGTCATSVTTQVGEAARFIGEAAGFATGDAGFAIESDALVSLVEFVTTTLGKLVVLAIKAWTSFEQRKQKVGLLVALLQMIEEAQAEVKKDKAVLRKLYVQCVVLIGELMHTFNTWHGWQSVADSGKIVEVLLKHRSLAVAEVYHLLNAYLHPSCNNLVGKTAKIT